MLCDKADVNVTSPRKILFPEDKYTKQQLINYYFEVSKYMLPHMKGRPISIQRFPNGIHEPGFFQKEASAYFPPYIKRVTVQLKQGKTKKNAIIENQASLIFLANLSTIQIHSWMSCKKNLNKPDMIIWDFDPTDGDFNKAREGAFILREYLTRFGVTSWTKVTASRGVHVAIPVLPIDTFDVVKELAKQVSYHLAAEHPELFTMEMLIENREKKVFIDYLRNEYGQTAIAPYSVRAKPGAPVAMPVTWKELEKPLVHSQSFNIRNAFKRLNKSGDAWESMHKSPQGLIKLHQEFR